jgi:hypothetical protein
MSDVVKQPGGAGQACDAPAALDMLEGKGGNEVEVLITGRTP